MSIQPQWTQQRIDALKSLWLDGYSATIISERLEIGRNAVIGKAYRLGLKRDDSVIIVGARGAITKSMTVRARRERGELPPAVRQPAKPKMKGVALKLPQPVEAAVVITLEHARPWQDRASQQCAYLLDDGCSCCMATGSRSSSYCAGHKALMFRPTEKLRVEKMARKFG